MYALDVRAGRLLRLTNAPFGALDPSLSPDGQTLAYVDYQHERYRLATIPFAPEAAAEVPFPSGFGKEVPWRVWLRQTSEEAVLDTAKVDLSDVRPYRALARLRPRAVFPVLRGDGDVSIEDADLGIGIGVQGADPLERWSYGGTAFYRARRLWGEAAVQSGRWRLRPRLGVYNRPYTVVGAQFYGIEERGVEAGLSLPVVLASNVYQSSLFLSLQGGFDQVRFIGEKGAADGPFTNRVTLRPSAALAYRVQANYRDLIPNTGVVLSTSARTDVYANRGERGRALVARLDLYLPLLRASNTGLRLNVGVLTQNRTALFDPLFFLPRGYGDVLLESGTFLRYEADVVQPLWFIDNGFLLVPFYAKALYTYGFAESIWRTAHSENRASGGEALSAVGPV